MEKERTIHQTLKSLNDELPFAVGGYREHVQEKIVALEHVLNRTARVRIEYVPLEHSTTLYVVLPKVPTKLPVICMHTDMYAKKTTLELKCGLDLVISTWRIRPKCTDLAGVVIPWWLFWYPDVTDEFDPSKSPRPSTRCMHTTDTDGPKCISSMYIYGDKVLIRKYCKNCQNYKSPRCWSHTWRL